jgi:hypothetical protein
MTEITLSIPSYLDKKYVIEEIYDIKKDDLHP